MGKKFLNNGIGPISFGKDYVVEQGEVIELSDELAEKKKQAIEQMLKSGQILKGGKRKLVEDDPENEPEDEAPEDNPEDEDPSKGKGKGKK